MLFFENIALALASLKSNKMRAVLTMLGIIIGIGSVICIDTLGNSLTVSVQNTMESSGSSNINMFIMQKRDDGGSGGRRRAPGSDDTFDIDRWRPVEDSDKYTEEMIDDLKEHFSDEITGITVNEELGNGKVSKGAEYANIKVVGINKDYMAHGSAPKMVAGSLLDSGAYKDGRAVCLVSDYFCNNLYNGDVNKAIGQTVDVTLSDTFYTFYIVGVYKYEADSFSFSTGSSVYDTTTSLYVPIKNIQSKTHTKGFDNITIITNTASGKSVDMIMNEVKSYLGKYYRKNDMYEPTAMSLGSIVAEFESLISGVKLVFSAIAAISLLVGGIGVMNIMLVSISERTREIGTRKALGASNESIRTQFIVEAVVLCFIGGAIGIALGIGTGSLGTKIMSTYMDTDITAAPSLSSMIIAVVFSLAIGVFFGYYPANKAAKMNPIDALRYE